MCSTHYKRSHCIERTLSCPDKTSPLIVFTNQPVRPLLLGGRTVYLGKYKSRSSREKYDQTIATFLTNGKQTVPVRSRDDIRIEEAIILFLEYAEKHYTKNARITKSFSNHQESLAYLNRWYGNKRVSEFGPVALQYLRERILEEGYVKRTPEGGTYREDYKRRTVNARIGCIVNFYRWLVTNEKCPVDLWTALKAVPRLGKGKSKGRESEPVRPVELEIVKATFPYLSPVVVDMVQVQLLTGARPGEICRMRVCDIDLNDPSVWKFVPCEHKTDYLDHSRQIPIGPRAQAILRPYLDRLADTGEQNIFSPKESVRQKNEQKRQKRRCKVYGTEIAVLCDPAEAKWRDRSRDGWRLFRPRNMAVG